MVCWSWICCGSILILTGSKSDYGGAAYVRVESGYRERYAASHLYQSRSVSDCCRTGRLNSSIRSRIKNISPSLHKDENERK
jgi:hypothetical protein